MSLRSAQQDRGDKDQDDGQDQRDRKPFQLPDGGHTHSASLAPAAPARLAARFERPRLGAMIPAMRLLDRYDAHMHRRLAARHGEEHAYREARAQARLAIAVVVGTALTGLAVLAEVAGQPDLASALRFIPCLGSRRDRCCASGASRSFKLMHYPDAR